MRDTNLRLDEQINGRRFTLSELNIVMRHPAKYATGILMLSAKIDADRPGVAACLRIKTACALDLTAQGGTVAALQKKRNAWARPHVGDAAVRGINIARASREAKEPFNALQAL